MPSSCKKKFHRIFLFFQWFQLNKKCLKTSVRSFVCLNAIENKTWHGTNFLAMTVEWVYNSSDIRNLKKNWNQFFSFHFSIAKKLYCYNCFFSCLKMLVIAQLWSFYSDHNSKKPINSQIAVFIENCFFSQNKFVLQTSAHRKCFCFFSSTYWNCAWLGNQLIQK